MKKIIALVVFVSGALFTYAQPPAGDANAGDIYGAKVKAKGAVAIAEVVTQLDGGAQLDDVKIKAKILEVCPNKGCPASTVFHLQQSRVWDRKHRTTLVPDSCSPG